MESERKPYQVELTRAARRSLLALPRDMQQRIDSAILGLAQAPRSPGSKKLRGAKNRYRLRVGDYRIIYDILDERLVVFVIDIDHRKDVYRN